MKSSRSSPLRNSTLNTLFKCCLCDKMVEIAVESPCCGTPYCRDCLKRKRSVGCAGCHSTYSNTEFSSFRVCSEESIRRSPKRNRLDSMDNSSSGLFRSRAQYCPQNCGALLTNENIEEHISIICGNTEVECVLCRQKTKRKYLPDHDCTSSAPLQQCSICLAMVPGDKFEEHVQNNLHTHLSMIMQAVQNQNKPAPISPNYYDISAHHPIPLEVHQVQHSSVVRQLEDSLSPTISLVNNTLSRISITNQVGVDDVLYYGRKIMDKTFGNPDVPLGVRLVFGLIMVLLLKGLLVGIFKFGVLGFVSFTVYRYLGSCGVLHSRDTRNVALTFYVMLILYLMYALL